MEFWKKLKYWQKGGVIGVLLSFVLPIIFLITFETIYFVSNLILKMYYVPHAFSQFILEGLSCNWCLYENLFLELLFGTLQFILLGTLIGLIIGKFKNQKKVRSK